MNQTIGYQSIDVLTSTVREIRNFSGIILSEAVLNETKQEIKSKFPPRLLQLLAELRKHCQDKMKSDDIYTSGEIIILFFFYKQYVISFKVENIRLKKYQTLM
jgi:hypothetical protein